MEQVVEYYRVLGPRVSSSRSRR